MWDGAPAWLHRPKRKAHSSIVIIILYEFNWTQFNLDRTLVYYTDLELDLIYFVTDILIK